MSLAQATEGRATLSQWRHLAVCCSVGALLCLAALANSGRGPRSLQLDVAHGDAVGALQLRAKHSGCSLQDDIVLPGNDLQTIPYVKSASRCCEKCRGHDRCVAWTWGKSGKGQDAEVCVLKGRTPRALTKVPTVGYVSGVPDGGKKDDDNVPALRPQMPGQSLFCFALVQPEGYEGELLGMQFEEQAGIFQCEEYALYSNRRLELAPGVVTGVVNSTLKCHMGGEFGTALNTGIFIALWAKVVQDGRFLYHDWSVKADPDTVFFADRLRLHVATLDEAPEGVYLNNCQYGLHGPLEVFSTNAVKNWAMGAGECVEFFTELCSGPCGWGEDMFIDQCLMRKLKAKRVNDYSLLMEAHCSPPADWDKCENSTVVAFHPFKKEKEWRECMANAQSQPMTFRKLAQ